MLGNQAVQPEFNLDEPPGGFLTFTDAAANVLEEFANCQPMHFREITRQALENHLISTFGITPANTMRAVIGRENARENARGHRPRFFTQPGGLIGLTAWQVEENNLFTEVAHHNQEIKQEYLEKLQSMTSAEFEDFVGELMVELQFEDVIVTNRTHDGGIDIKCVLNVAGTLRIKMAVQVKRWRHNVQSPVVQQLRGALGAHEQGLIITTSKFANGAIQEAQRTDVAPIGLINGTQLVDLLVENGIGIKRAPLDWVELSSADV